MTEWPLLQHLLLSREPDCEFFVDKMSCFTFLQGESAAVSGGTIRRRRFVLHFSLDQLTPWAPCVIIVTTCAVMSVPRPTSRHVRPTGVASVVDEHLGSKVTFRGAEVRGVKSDVPGTRWGSGAPARDLPWGSRTMARFVRDATLRPSVIQDDVHASWPVRTMPWATALGRCCPSRSSTWLISIKQSPTRSSWRRACTKLLCIHIHQGVMWLPFDPSPSRRSKWIRRGRRANEPTRSAQT